MSTQLLTMGWREWIVFPDLGVRPVKAKVDTGARSSTLHAEDIELIQQSGVKKVQFRVYPLQRSKEKSALCVAELHDERWIKSSNGGREMRPVIRARIQWSGCLWDIDLTLTSRDLMGFRMLLGREAVRGRCLVHSGRSFLGGKLSRRTGEIVSRSAIDHSDSVARSSASKRP